jgi:hypothetical protein
MLARSPPCPVYESESLETAVRSKVATEMALHVLAYNLTRVMNIMGIQPLIAVMSVPP